MDLGDKEFKLPYQKPMPCLAENNAWLECYKEYAKDILKCSPLVKSFEDCIRQASSRQQQQQQILPQIPLNLENGSGKRCLLGTLHAC
nr:hypothetical protein CFP56_58003 [Quercus suber]